MAKAKACESIDDYVAKLGSPHREIVQALRKFVKDTAPNLDETIKWGNPTWTRKSNVCWIISYKDHVDFGFFRGTDLNDPKDLLEGTGEGLRHVKIHDVTGVRPTDLKPLLKQAIALDGA